MTPKNPRAVAARRRAERRRAYRSRLLSVDEMLERLGDENGPLSRRTWQAWRACGKAPKCYKLPNGRVVCTVDEFERWFENLMEETGVAA
ncbi:hypothetical protein GCM10027447_16820 [Glycomyces halotolerans]